MREIGTVSNARDAQRLADYLLTLGIRTRVDAKEGGASVWAYEEDQREQATRELTQFNSNPADPRYDAAASQARQLEREAAVKEKQYQKRVVDLRERWDSGRMGRGPITLLLVAVSCGVAFGYGFGERPEGVVRLSDLWITPVVIDRHVVGFVPLRATFESGQWWRLVTPIFIHMSLMHLLFNMYTLIDVGSQVEMRRGPWRMAALVLGIAVVSNLAQYWWNGPAFGGMSGVVFGLFGYVWAKSRFDPAAGFFMHPSTAFMLGVWYVLCVAGAIGAIANAAHTAGFVAGALAAVAPIGWRRLRA